MEKQDLSLAHRLLSHLWKQPGVVDFAEPVDYVGLGLTDYLRVVKRPMDLGTIRRKLKRKEYAGLKECLADVQLVWDNCRTYNVRDSPIVRRAEWFEQETQRFLSPFQTQEVTADPAVVSFEEQLALAERVKKAAASTVQEVVRVVQQHCPAAVLDQTQDHMKISVQALDSATYQRLKSLLK